MTKSILNDALGQVGSLGKQTVKQVVKVPKDVLETAANQAGIEKKPETSGGETQMPQVTRNKDTEDFVKGLYGASQEVSNVSKVSEVSKGDQGERVQNVPDQQPADQTNQQAQTSADKSPEEQAKIQQLTSKLHQETYYQPLTNRPKTQEEVEKPKERVERIEMEELQREEEKKKKKVAQDEDISLERERTKTEKRPGAG